MRAQDDYSCSITGSYHAPSRQHVTIFKIEDFCTKLKVMLFFCPRTSDWHYFLNKALTLKEYAFIVDASVLNLPATTCLGKFVAQGDKLGGCRMSYVLVHFS